MSWKRMLAVESTQGSSSMGYSHRHWLLSDAISNVLCAFIFPVLSFYQINLGFRFSSIRSWCSREIESAYLLACLQQLSSEIAFWYWLCALWNVPFLSQRSSWSTFFVFDFIQRTKERKKTKRCFPSSTDFLSTKPRFDPFVQNEVNGRLLASYN